MENYDFVYNLKLANNSNQSPFIKELFEMDNRILHCGIVEADLDEDHVNPTGHFYIPCKEFLLFSGIQAIDVGHQIAHFVEMNNLNRLTMGDFGFGKVTDVHRRMDKSKGPYFIAAFMREMRVRAIQLHIYNEELIYSKGKESYHYNGRHYETINRKSILDHVYFGDVIKFLPFGKFKDVKSFQEFVYAQEEKIYNSWSQERIYSEWVKRLDYIRNWMETKEEKLAALWIYLCLPLKN